MAGKILLLAGDTDGNLGDRAIVTATCDYLRRLDPGVEISLVSSCSDRDRKLIGVRTIPRGWLGLPMLLATARRSDLVICGGGGLFQDDDSLVKMPYWAARLLLVRLFCPRIAGLSIGAGPLAFGLSRFFARLALRTLHPISVRDAHAKDVLSRLTENTIEIVPDPAFLLQAGRREDARQLLSDNGIPLDRTPLIGVAARRCFHTGSNLVPQKYLHKLGLGRNRGKEPMDVLIKRLATVLDRIVSESGAHVVFLPTYNVEHEGDLGVCESIARSMSTASHSVLRIDDPKTYKAVTGLMSVMLCGRMHPAILAAAEGTPVVGLAYNPKFFGAFSLFGLAKNCVSVNQFVAEDTCATLAGNLLSAIKDPGSHRPQTAGCAHTTRRYLETLVQPMPVPARIGSPDKARR